MTKRQRMRIFLARWITVLIPAALLTAIGASALTHGHYTLDGEQFAVSWTLIAVAALLAVVEGAAVARRQLHVAVVVGERDAYRDRALGAEKAIIRLIRMELIALQERAHLFSSDRVNLFRCDGDHFTLVGRRSARPLFDESVGRRRYPLDEGVLGMAWAETPVGVTSLPDPGPQDQPPSPAWLDAQRELNVPEDVAARLTMRSQTYAAFRIAGPEHSFGVVVFESTVAVTEAAAAGASPTKRTVDELLPLVREASGRLAALLGQSFCLSSERVRELLEDQRGPRARQS